MEITDKRKIMSEAKLAHLEKMRASRIEKQKQKKVDTEYQAKMDVLKEQDDQEQVVDPDPEPEPEPPVKIKAPVPRKPQSVQYDGLSLDEVGLVREFVNTAKEKKKAEKWEARKKEIVAQVILTLIPDEPETETEPQYVTKPTSSLSLYGDDFF
jgi:hypothetical protein